MAQHGFYEDAAKTLQRNEDRLKRQEQARLEDQQRAAGQQQMRRRKSI